MFSRNLYGEDTPYNQNLIEASAFPTNTFSSGLHGESLAECPIRFTEYPTRLDIQDLMEESPATTGTTSPGSYREAVERSSWPCSLHSIEPHFPSTDLSRSRNYKFDNKYLTHLNNQCSNGKSALPANVSFSSLYGGNSTALSSHLSSWDSIEPSSPSEYSSEPSSPTNSSSSGLCEDELKWLDQTTINTRSEAKSGAQDHALYHLPDEHWQRKTRRPVPPSRMGPQPGSWAEVRYKTVEPRSTFSYSEHDVLVRPLVEDNSDIDDLDIGSSLCEPIKTNTAHIEVNINGTRNYYLRADEPARLTALEKEKLKKRKRERNGGQSSYARKWKFQRRGRTEVGSL